VKTDTVLNGVLLVLSACAITVTGLFVKREFWPSELKPTSSGPALEKSEVADWESYLSSGNRLGPSSALVTVVEFSDFQCPYCAQVAERLSKTREKYGGQMAILFRHYPITARHPHALGAALSSECAAGQGRFEEFHDVLFMKQDSIGIIGWADLAKRSGIANLQAFERCTRDSLHADRVDRDIAAGNRLGLTGTPTLLINGQMLRGAPSQSVLDSMVHSEIARRVSSTR